jgi:hypothetical protein
MVTKEINGETVPVLRSKWVTLEAEPLTWEYLEKIHIDIFKGEENVHRQ